METGEKVSFHDVDAGIRRVLSEEPGSTLAEIAEETGLPPDRVVARLRAGVEKGVLGVRVHARGERCERAYWLTGRGA